MEPHFGFTSPELRVSVRVWRDFLRKRLAAKKGFHVPKRYVPITIITVLLAITAVAGYMRPAPKFDMPPRILFDNSGGNVVFTHLAHHRDYDIACSDCHHEHTDLRSAPLACGSCHPEAFDKEYVAGHIESFPDPSYCVDCHHAEFHSMDFDHEGHQEYAPDCTDCHHDEDIEPEPQKCSNCHSKMAGDADMPSVRDAAHDRCESCHDHMFEKGLEGCTPCHKLIDMSDYDGEYTTCAQCHQKETKDLMVTRTSAFHDQCIGCHEELGMGPYTDKDCGKCHIR